MKLHVLSTGSCGNAVLVETRKSRVLLDAGLSASETFTRMERCGVHRESLDAVLVTHEHSDHSRGAWAIAKQTGATLYAPYKFLAGLNGDPTVKTCVLHKDHIHADVAEDVHVVPVELPHNAETYGFLINVGRVLLGYYTDLGTLESTEAELLRGCDVIYLESNYDADMLAASAYDNELKLRIRGPLGHLSNDQVALFLQGGTKADRIILGHLSSACNREILALESAKAAIESSKSKSRPGHIAVLSPGERRSFEC